MSAATAHFDGCGCPGCLGFCPRHDAGPFGDDPLWCNDPCQAKECFRHALTTFTDGAGKHLGLCESHGDLLAVGFPLKPVASSPSSAETDQ